MFERCHGQPLGKPEYWGESNSVVCLVVVVWGCLLEDVEGSQCSGKTPGSVLVGTLS